MLVRGDASHGGGAAVYADYSLITIKLVITFLFLAGAFFCIAYLQQSRGSRILVRFPDLPVGAICRIAGQDDYYRKRNSFDLEIAEPSGDAWRFLPQRGIVFPLRDTIVEVIDL